MVNKGNKSTIVDNPSTPETVPESGTIVPERGTNPTNDVTNPKQHRYSQDEVDLVLRCLIEGENKATLAIEELKRISGDPMHEENITAVSILEWINDNTQKPYRYIYDIRRGNYNRYYELILEEKAIGRLIAIIASGSEESALKAHKQLDERIHGKPTQEVKMTNFVSHAEVQGAVNEKVAKIPAHQWQNPRDRLASQAVPALQEGEETPLQEE